MPQPSRRRGKLVHMGSLYPLVRAVTRGLSCALYVCRRAPDACQRARKCHRQCVRDRCDNALPERVCVLRRRFRRLSAELLRRQGARKMGKKGATFSSVQGGPFPLFHAPLILWLSDPPPPPLGPPPIPSYFPSSSLRAPPPSHTFRLRCSGSRPLPDPPPPRFRLPLEGSITSIRLWSPGF